MLKKCLVRGKLMFEKSAWKNGNATIYALWRMLEKCHNLRAITHVGKMLRFTRFDACWRIVAIYALCQAQNFGCQALSTILHPCLWQPSLLNSFRTEGTSHMLIDFSDILQVDVYELGRTYLRLSQVPWFLLELFLSVLCIIHT